MRGSFLLCCAQPFPVNGPQLTSYYGTQERNLPWISFRCNSLFQTICRDSTTKTTALNMKRGCNELFLTPPWSLCLALRFTVARLEPLCGPAHDDICGGIWQLRQAGPGVKELLLEPYLYPNSLYVLVISQPPEERQVCFSFLDEVGFICHAALHWMGRSPVTPR